MVVGLLTKPLVPCGHVFSTSTLSSYLGLTSDVAVVVRLAIISCRFRPAQCTTRQELFLIRPPIHDLIILCLDLSLCQCLLLNILDQQGF